MVNQIKLTVIENMITDIKTYTGTDQAEYEQILTQKEQALRTYILEKYPDSFIAKDLNKCGSIQEYLYEHKTIILEQFITSFYFQIPELLDKPLAVLGQPPKFQVFWEGRNCIVGAVHCDDNYPEHQLAVWNKEDGLKAIKEEIINWKKIPTDGSLFQPLWVMMDATDGKSKKSYGDYTDQGLEGYTEESFYPQLLTPATPLRDEIKYTPKQQFYIDTFAENPFIPKNIIKYDVIVKGNRINSGLEEGEMEDFNYDFDSQILTPLDSLPDPSSLLVLYIEFHMDGHEIARIEKNLSKETLLEFLKDPYCLLD
jgi:hypothetical protein